MKRLFILFIVLAMCLSFAACGGVTPATPDDDTTLPTQDETVNNTDDKNEKDDEKEISFTEIVVVDNTECSIKITGIDPDNMWGFTLKVLLENKSSEKNYMFSVESAAINGVQGDPFFASEVAAGKKSNKEISFSESTFKGNNIGDYTDIELTFSVSDSDDWMADDIVNETVHVYPYGKDNAVEYNRGNQPTDNVIVDNEFVTVIVTGYENDDIWGYSVNLFYVNKTDKNIMFSVDDVSVNGFMADPFYAESVMAGKCAFDSMSWSDTTFEENDITSVEEIEFNLRAYDDDNWMSDEDFVNTTVTLNP